MKKVLSSAVCIAAVATSVLSAREAHATSPMEVYFSPKGGGHDAVARAVTTATKTIDIAMYSISPGQVAMWKPLTDAVNRGVKCRFILDSANGDNKAKATAVENIKCDVHFVPGTMHQKFAIIDGGTYLTTGSANWSTGAEQKYSENVTVYSGFLAVAGQYQAEFERLWTRSADYPIPEGTTRAKYGKKVYGTGTRPGAIEGIESLFTMQNSKESQMIMDSLVQLINNATTSIDVAVAHFNAEEISTAVCAAQARGIKVRVLVDSGQFSIST